MSNLKSPSAWKTFRTLTRYIWPKDQPQIRFRVVVAFVCLLLSKGINVSVPYFLKSAVDALSMPVTLMTLPLGFILAYGTARILQQIFGELRDFLFAKVSQKAQTAVAMETFAHLHQLSLRFHLDRQTGGLSRIIERGTSAINYFLNFMTFNIVPTIIEIVIVTGALFVTFGPQFAGITFVTIAIYILYTVKITDWRVQYRRQMNEADTDANTKAVDSLLNFETVKYFGNEEHEYRRFHLHRLKYEGAAIKSQGTLALLNMGQGFVIAGGLIGVMVLAGQGVMAHRMTLGDFVMINTFLIQLYMPLNFLGFVYREIKQGLIDMEKMFDILKVDQDIQDHPNAKPLVTNGGQIEFKNVSFSYRPDRAILKDLSFKIPHGHTIALVGESGSGKSTVARLLYRFYDIQEGSICIDGQNIREVTQKSVRSKIGIVPQDTVLFNDTIEYNIRYGRPEATQGEIHEAARLAQIHSFIETLPEKYQTRVGERGLKLSGGEKQRVAIARTILKQPAILIFDEATSALDSKTEQEIQDALLEVSKGKTTLVIAHRLSTIVHANEILVLKSGTLIERGSHSALMKKAGEYSEMWRRQQEQREYQEKLQQLQ